VLADVFSQYYKPKSNHQYDKPLLLGAFEKSVKKIFLSFRVNAENTLASCKIFFINQIKSRTKNREQISGNAGLYNYKLKFSIN
jgi:hypothetical protein